MKPFSKSDLKVLTIKIKKKLESKKLNWYIVLSELILREYTKKKWSSKKYKEKKK